MHFLASYTVLFKRYCRVSFSPVSHGVESKFRNYLSSEHTMEQVPHCVILIGLNIYTSIWKEVSSCCGINLPSVIFLQQDINIRKSLNPRISHSFA